MIIIKKQRQSIEKQKIEVVELKGRGHPDTICDDICEIASHELSKYYKKHFKKILHHNVDKCLLVAGQSLAKFKKGKIKYPIKIILAGRATSKTGKKRIPVKSVITKAVKKYLKQFLLAKFKLELEIQQGASNLILVPKKRVANDTSIGCGHYPFSRLEKTVKRVHNYLQNLGRKEIGKDIKIMGIRHNNEIQLIIAIAFVSKYIKDMYNYIDIKEELIKRIKRKFKVKAEINTLDNYKDPGSIYLTVSGLSAENGDDGGAGRGNRYNGLITPHRMMSIESVAGKNIFHPGKTYQMIAEKIAKDIVKLGAKQAEVELVSEIGKPLSEPKLVFVKIVGRKRTRRIKKIIKHNLKRL